MTCARKRNCGQKEGVTGIFSFVTLYPNMSLVDSPPSVNPSASVIGQKRPRTDEVDDDVCPTPIELNVEHENESLTMYVPIKGTQVDLFSIFNNEPGSQMTEVMLRHIQSVLETYFAYDRLYFTIQLTEEGKNMELGYFETDIQTLHRTDPTFIELYLNPYIFYIFANNNIISLKTQDTAGNYFYPPAYCHIGGQSHPPQHGIHEDGTDMTSLTFLDSEMTTELIFNIPKESLEFTGRCKPIFRFLSTGKLYTLSFNNKLMLHSEPCEARELPYAGQVGEFELIRRELNRNLPASRKPVCWDRSKQRKVILLLVNPNRDTFQITPHKFTHPITEFMAYQNKNAPTLIELSDTAIKSLMTETHLAGFQLSGGVKKRRRTLTRKRPKTKKQRTRRKKSTNRCRRYRRYCSNHH